MYQFHDLNSGGGAAALRPSPQPALAGTAASLDAALLRPSIPADLGAGGLASVRDRLSRLRLVTDLGQNLGSPEWIRGFALCAGLCYAALSLAPGIDPLPGTAPGPLPDAQWEEARALSIAPLAHGADTGRRMAATDAVEPLSDTPERPSIQLTTTLGRGDVGRALERAGVSKDDAAAVASLIAGSLADGIRPGTIGNITLGRRPNKKVPRPLDALAFRAAFDLRVEIKRADGKLVLQRIPIAVDDTPLRIQGRVGSSLYRAARAAGAPASAVESFLRAIATQTEISSIGANDRFDLIIEHRRAETGETETGKLLYAGLERAKGKKLQLMQWEQGGRAQWFEASGVGKTSGTLQRPVPGKVSSNFGMRHHPILGYSRMHKGMDFRAGYGTPILAAADGKIVRAGWAGGYGKQVRIDHAGGLATSYSHMSRIAAKPGQRVKQGQVIGYVGSTGLSTGPHLHYELYRNGTPVNPATVKFTTRAQLNKTELAAFKAKLRKLLAVPAGAASAQEVRTAGKDRPGKADDDA